jgi:ABC-2 type transport system ATP-binding protein
MIDDASDTDGLFDPNSETGHPMIPLLTEYISGCCHLFLLDLFTAAIEPLLILDQPTAGLDVQIRRDLWRVIERLNAGGTTILLTTHYIEEAERLCDRVAICDSGRIVEVATPDELRSRGTDQVFLTLADTPTTVPDIDVDGVIDTSLDGDRLVVTAKGGGRVAPGLLRALEYEGYRVLDLDIRRASLEEVFVDMTRLDEPAEELGAIQ